MRVGKLSLLFSLVLISGLLSGCGCAKKDDLDALRAETQESRRIAEQALNAANEARQTAYEANTRSERVEEVVNRGFKKSMYK